MADDENPNPNADPLLPRPHDQVPTPSDDFPETQVGHTPPDGQRWAWDDAPTGPIRVVSVPSPAPVQPDSVLRPTGSQPGRGRLIGVIAAGLVAVVAVAAAVFFINRTPEASPTSTIATPTSAAVTESSATTSTLEVNLESADSTGSDPFSESVAVTPVTDFPDEVVEVIDEQATTMAVNSDAGTLTSPGVEPALYGGSNEMAVCDVQMLTQFLANDEKKARAWAFARGITVAGIPEYLAGLTPVVLLHDTAVTNFGYADGAAMPFQAVLQAGTAVLVDSTGLPVVRCACGNPLAAPIAKNLPDADFLGEPWAGFEPSESVVVTPGPSSVDGFTLVDVVTGELFDVPLGWAAPVAETSAAPEVVGCEFQTYGEIAWVETDPGVTADCSEMIAHWKKYENWTGERNGQAQHVDFPDGGGCGWNYIPLNERDNGAIGFCDFSDGRAFTIWRGQLGQHLTEEGVEAGSVGEPAPGTQQVPTAGDQCTDGTHVFDNSRSPDPISCEEMQSIWAAFKTTWPDGAYNDDGSDGWICFIPSGNDLGGCGRSDGSDGGSFAVYPLGLGLPGTGNGENGNSEGADEGEPETEGYDLGLSVPISYPSCDGMGIAVLGSFFTPGAYEVEVQARLDQFPGSSYLRTDQSCTSLNPSKNGNAIYMVYRPIGYDATAVCAVVNAPEAAAVSAYGKWLENSDDVGSQISC